ncbi:hypothetical protein AtubIFM56815_005024 [Aspergillus tubingensis]|uniref:Rhodopsin domain-containing protein n=1 Tax=Aspergillus tubingensis TaxID=5068 RepID=A0A9W6AEB6_ASPTU|nr:hypothetical protein AtubIFM56815_005024 [Aspergillus tubingensis]
MAMITVGATYGLGLPQDMLSFNESKMALLYGWVNQLIALVAIGLGKLTIVAFLEQVQGYQTKARSIFLWSLAGSNLVVNCVAAILMMLQCSPRRMLWEAYTKEYCPYRSRIQIFGYIQGHPSQQIGTVIVWNQTEMWVVFIVSCIPPTKVFFKHVYRRSSIRLGSFVDHMRPREHETKQNESLQSSC